MNELSTSVPDLVLAGRLRKEYLLPLTHGLIWATLGNLAYVAASALMWNAKPGMLARLNQTYPPDWVEDFELADAIYRGFAAQRKQLMTVL